MSDVDELTLTKLNRSLSFPLYIANLKLTKTKCCRLQLRSLDKENTRPVYQYYQDRTQKSI